MAKLKLVPEPTFTADVPIPMITGEPVKVRMTFRHRKKTDLQEWLSTGRTDKSDTDIFMDVVIGWELEDAFTRDNVTLLCENYHGAAFAALKTYIETLQQAKLGN